MKKGISVLLSASMLFLVSCSFLEDPPALEPGSSDVSIVAPEVAVTETAVTEETEETVETEPVEEQPVVEPNGEVCILITSDVHCGIENGFGYAGLYEIRENLEGQGYDTILIDDGDSIQGDTIGTLSQGEAIIDLMNEMGYDAAIPGNHEFDYGTDRFLELTGMADYPYISCNFNQEGEPVFDPYVMIETCGMKIAFVGMTTPVTFKSSTPGCFQDDEGNYIYSFMQEDMTGEALYQAVQDAVDAARADGADYVFAMGHLGNEAACEPWTYGDVIANTTGIDAFFDGHSHDTDEITMLNADGEEVTRYAVGTKLSCIGYMFISPDAGITDAGIWKWDNDICAPVLLGIENEMSEQVALALADVEASMGEVIASTDVDLFIYDPVEVDEDGDPIRMIKRSEMNLGDLCADAVRAVSGADIGLVNGGGIKSNIPAGDITYGDILNVNPYGNQVCLVEVTGSQILDALEWGARSVPEECGAFLHVSGLTYEIDMNVTSGCTSDENGLCTGITGTRRVSNVMVGDQPLDPNATYTVAGWDFVILKNGDGFSAFDGCTVLSDGLMSDSQALIKYITEDLGGVVGEEYEDPYGQGRITIVQ